MADEPNRYEQIVTALRVTYKDLMEEDIKYVSQDRGAYTSPDPTTWARDAEVVRQALASPGLIMGLAKHLFGEIEE